MKLKNRVFFVVVGILILVLAACAPTTGPETGPENDTDPTETPAVSPEMPPKAVLDAQQWLSDQTNVPVEEIEIVETEQAEWTDSCLGLGQPNESCLQAITPGWRVVFQAGGQQVEVRTNEDASAIRSPQFTPEIGAPGLLENTQWELVSMGEPGQETPVVEGTQVTLIFESGGQVGGNGGCNSYGGSYEIQDGSLVFQDIVSTLMACADPAANNQETQFFEALQTAGEFENRGDQLMIRYNDGQGVLNFAPLTGAAGS